MNKFILLVVFFLGTTLSFAQSAGQSGTSAQQPEVIDLTKLGKTYKISARVELPQVKMFSRRLKPDLKEVSADKSFASELSAQAEEIQFKPITSGKVMPIPDIEALLKKKRF